jgi:hypothetical protein
MSTHAEHARSAGAIDPIALALEVAVYAPIGAAAYLREVGPDFVRMVAARGRAEVEVRQEQVATGVRHAKGAGQVAIAFGLPLVRKRVEKRLASLRSQPAAQPAPKPAAPPARPRPTPGRAGAATPKPAGPNANATVGTNGHRVVDVVEHVVKVDNEAPAPAGDSAAVEERLAIPGYDALSASQVVERLAGLSGDELAAVQRYEAGHRRRRTILGKIEQLSS